MNCCVDVAVSGATLKFDKLYSYEVPKHLEEYVSAGVRVIVPFGNGKPRMGIILKDSDIKDNLKQIIDIEREGKVLNDELVELIFYLKSHTLCSYDAAMTAMIPKYSRVIADIKEKDVYIKRISSAHLENVYVKAGSIPITLTERQKEVVELLENPLNFNEIKEKLGVTRDTLERMVSKGVLKKEKREKRLSLYQDYESFDSFDLSISQKRAYENITEKINGSSFPSTTLLYGVTSSGKTLIYIKLIQDAIENGKKALLLVPEIALATQLILRFKRWLGERVGIIHSSLSDTERQIEWQRIKRNECDLVIGTRSAVFVPLSDIGIVIVDEEQEQSYYSEYNPRYSAVEVAANRARYHKAHLLLSSATPSVESYYAASIGKYNLVELNERYMDMPLPDVEVVDMRNELLLGNSLTISSKLKEEIDKRLSKKEQVILLLNRRGYRTVSICSSCKEIVKCKSCDAAMVYHKQSGKYMCHYCSHSEIADIACSFCGKEIRQTGIGTQRIEEELSLIFPSARILRLDLDSTGRKNALEEKIKEFSKGDYDIIIGTQMVAKGLDFKNVTLVGVLCIDQMMLMSNFRASERVFSLLTQVIGRSGRGEKEGEAIIQTIDPVNPIITLAARQDYPAFYSNEITSRKMHLYPPFCAMSAAMVVGKDEKKVREAADIYAEILQQRVKNSSGQIPIRILGPVPTRIAYVSDMFRYKVTLKSRGDKAFRDMISDSIDDFYKLKESKDVNINFNFYDDGEI